MNEATKAVKMMSSDDVAIMTDAINHVNEQFVLGDDREELTDFLTHLCDQYGGSPLVAFADYVRNTATRG